MARMAQRMVTLRIYWSPEEQRTVGQSGLKLRTLAMTLSAREPATRMQSRARDWMLVRVRA